MFREIEDDAIECIAIPWHGLITDGTLTLQDGSQIWGAAAGNNTYLFDAGVPPIETPPEIAAAGGEVWNKAIVNFSGSRAVYHCGLTSQGKLGLPLRFPTAAPPIRDIRIDLDLGPVTGLRLRYAPAGAWIDRPLTPDDIGQSAGPDIHVIAGPGQVARPTRYSLSIMDVRGGNVLCIVHGSAPYATDTELIDRHGELSREYTPIVPLGLVELVFGADGNQVLLSEVRVVEDRAAALGSLQFSQSYSNTLEDAVVVGFTEWSGEWPTPPDCSGVITGTATTIIATPDYSGGGYVSPVRRHRGTESSRFEQIMTGALLAARYGADGAVQTARYTARRTFDYEYVATLTAEGVCTLTQTFVNVGTHCAGNPLARSGAAYGLWTRIGEYSAEHTLTLYGFDGQQADSASVRAEGSAELISSQAYESDGSHPWSREASVSISSPFGTTESDSEDAYFSVLSALDTHGSYPDVPTTVAPFDGLGGVMVEHEISLIRYSNNLFGLCALDHSELSDGEGWSVNRLVLLPALHWGGTDPRVFEFELSAWTALRQHIQALSGASYNPVTHQVARGEYGKNFSWV